MPADLVAADPPVAEEAPEAAVAEPAAVDEPEGPRWIGWALVALIAGLAAWPIVLAGIQGMAQTWYPAGDWASTALSTHDVGTARTPLVGVYSRYGWNHPGPLMFWLYAVPYRLLGASFSGLLLAAAAINAASVIGMVLLAWRRGRLALALPLAVGLAVVAESLGLSLLRDPWNPWITVLPFGLLVVATWSAVERDEVGLVVAVGVGAFLSQAHLGMVPLAGLLTVVAVGGYVLRGGRRKALVVAGIVLGLCWLPVLVHVLTGGDNLSRLLDHLTGDHEVAGLDHSLGLAARQLRYLGDWRGTPEKVSPVDGGVEPDDLGELQPALFVWALALVLSRLAGPRVAPAHRLLWVVGVAAAGGVLSVSRISDTVYGYLIRWWWPLAALWWVAAGWALALVALEAGRALLRRAGTAELTARSVAGVRDRVRRVGASEVTIRSAAVAGVALVAIALVLVPPVRRASTGDEPLLVSPEATNAQAPLANLVTYALPQVPTDRPVLLRAIGPNVGWIGDGLALQLIAAGYDTRFDDESINRFKFGPERITVPDESSRALVLMSGIGILDLERMGGARELTRWDPLSRAERDEAWALQRALRDQFDRLDRQDLVDAVDRHTSLWAAEGLEGVDQEALARFEELRQRGEPVAAFLYEEADVAPLHT